MKRPLCPKCKFDDPDCPKVRHHGSYYRTADRKTVTRYRCPRCGSTFSTATLSPQYRRKARTTSKEVQRWLCSTVSQRRLAKNLGINRKTLVRSFRIEAKEAEFRFYREGLRIRGFSEIQFDDLETFEHTKCKPVSVTLAVENRTRRILAIEVSQMPANGKLAKKSREKYGPRGDERRLGRLRLFEKLSFLAVPDATFESDENPFYPRPLKELFPKASHHRYKGSRGSSTGYGEIKQVGYDPLFSLNHTCAMLRANINRLLRKTWCTTKKLEELYLHLVLYADFHNSQLIPQPLPLSGATG